MLAVGKVVYVQKRRSGDKVRHFFVLSTGLPCVFTTKKELKLKGRTVQVEGIPYRDKKGRIILSVSNLLFIKDKKVKGAVYVKGKVVKRFLSYSDEEKTREFILLEETSGRKIPVEAWNAPDSEELAVRGYVKNDVAGGHIVKALEVVS